MTGSPIDVTCTYCDAGPDQHCRTKSGRRVDRPHVHRRDLWRVHATTPRRPVRVYVAGASVEIERSERFRDAVIAAGFEITFDWAAAIRQSGKANRGMTRDERVAASRACRLGVKRAAAFVMLMPSAGTCSPGMWVELGVALSSFSSVDQFGPVCIVVDDDERSIMTADAVAVATEDEAIAFLGARFRTSTPRRTSTTS